MVTANDAINRISAVKNDLRQRFLVRDLAIFGSAARNEMGPASDIDVLVEFEGAPTFDAYMGTRFFLEDLLGVLVDLVTPAALRPELRSSIERDLIHVP